MYLIDYLPLYKSSEEAIAIQTGYQWAIDALWADVFALFEEAYLDTAVESLDAWEDLYAVPRKAGLDPERRRERIRAKMRGSGTTTVAMIENVARSFHNGEINVIEHNDEYYFVVDFVSQKGRPPGMEAMREAIEEIKPAHLGVVWGYTKITHDDIKNSRYTHQQLSAYTHEFIREELPLNE